MKQETLNVFLAYLIAISGGADLIDNHPGKWANYEKCPENKSNFDTVDRVYGCFRHAG